MIMCIQNLVLICLFFLKILCKKQIPTSIKARYSVANLRKTMIFDTNIDLVNDNVYESFYKNEGIWEEQKQKNNTAYFDSFSFKTEL